MSAAQCWGGGRNSTLSLSCTYGARLGASSPSSLQPRERGGRGSGLTLKQHADAAGAHSWASHLL